MKIVHQCRNNLSINIFILADLFLIIIMICLTYADEAAAFKALVTDTPVAARYVDAGGITVTAAIAAQTLIPV